MHKNPRLFIVLPHKTGIPKGKGGEGMFAEISLPSIFFFFFSFFLPPSRTAVVLLTLEEEAGEEVLAEGS